jgi:hypothetical protein
MPAISGHILAHDPAAPAPALTHATRYAEIYLFAWHGVSEPNLRSRRPGTAAIPCSTAVAQVFRVPASRSPQRPRVAAFGAFGAECDDNEQKPACVTAPVPVGIK